MAGKAEAHHKERLEKGREAEEKRDKADKKAKANKKK